MKILRIIARLNVGGPARHVVWLTRGLADEYDCILAAGRVPEGEEDMAYLADAYGVKPIFIEQMSRELSLNDIVSLFKIYRLMRQEKPDLVCTHTAKAGTVGRAAAFLYRWLTPSALIGKPRKLAVTHTFHGHVFHSYYGPLKTRLFVFIEKILARFATNKIIVISNQQLKEI
ncbi:MAG: glycosyltransferase, partial [Acidobacteria bacterium]|nr:glycosyltransferase [Acidobacteriota bacterium]